MTDISRAGIFGAKRSRRELQQPNTVPKWVPARKAGLARDEWQCRAKVPDGSPCTGAPDAYHVAPLVERWRGDRDLSDLSNPAPLCRCRLAHPDVVARAAR